MRKTASLSLDVSVSSSVKGFLESSDTGVQRIYQTVLQSVMNHRLAPGTKLSEAALCDLFGVGRTTVQKALQKLAHEHIVELRPNRGAIVAMPTPEETRELFEARRVLESAIVRLATEKATPDDFAQLREQLAKEHDAMHTFKQTEWACLASSFHLKISELTGNPVLSGYLKELISRCSLIVALHEPSGHASCEHEEHTRIVESMENGDAEAAIQAMEEHLSVLEKRIDLVSQQSDKSLARMLGLV